MSPVATIGAARDPDRTARRAGLIAGLGALAGGALTLNHLPVGVFYDDSLYAGAAYALSHGLGYVYPNLPGHPGVVHYPPLYPLLLAPLFGLFSIPVAAFVGKLINILLAGVASGLIAWHATRRNLLGPVEQVPPYLAAVLVGAAALVLPVLTILSVLLSEPLFSVLLALAVILADHPPDGWSPEGAALLAGVATALVLLTRSIGVAAGAGALIYLFVVRRATWRQLWLAAAPLFVAGAGWGLWILRHRAAIDPGMATNYGSYLETARTAGVGIFWHGLRGLPRPLGELALGWLPGSALYVVFGLATLAVLIYGLGLIVRRSSIGFTLVGYFAILAAWPFPVERFIWAVLPWLALAWACGAIAIWWRPALRPLRVPVALLASAMAVGYVRAEALGILSGSAAWRPPWTALALSAEEVFPAIQALPPDARIAADFEPMFWLYTRRTSVPFYMFSYRGREVISPTPAEQRAYLERQGVTYILIPPRTSVSAPQLDALHAAYPQWVTFEARWSGGWALFRLSDSGPVSR